MQPYISSLSVSGAPTTPAAIGAAFAAACAAPPFSRAAAVCQDMSEFIAKSNNGNLGRRAGELTVNWLGYTQPSCAHAAFGALIDMPQVHDMYISITTSCPSLQWSACMLQTLK
jgi:hypothetical protein